MVINGLEICSLAENTGHIPAISQLLHEEWSAFENWAEPARISQRLQTRISAGHHEFTLVALADEQGIAGTASVIRYELADRAEREYWLGEVFTCAPVRGKGIGSALVRACVKKARAAGIDALWLYTPDQQALYARLGWQEAEQRELAGEQVTVMMLPL
ncbi:MULTISPECIES: GNAT family N-acetyltransferase [Rahnella]|jgi:predicted N-acetyltransferase YhbS|uniref:GNAT family N-acetyltransferase n=1 Tax=Rahnella victoriana TaxID=1510570 RepID=A0ABS0DQV5_9GAMM|nr:MULTISPECIES: GNAT family N-acetyltransferase [Rahnella]MBF7956270.1 GNAT family N-acetyltransferase [Rahnella victoriana]TBX33974.1 GNAT family N-acetyltransferase [Rahnella victoriana]TDS87822.1 putative N-acetyltransferase YhbS [Rahnella sp. BIGb0236]VTQ61271.1 Predicted acetyltransferase [Campylobacter jejuni]